MSGIPSSWLPPAARLASPAMQPRLQPQPDEEIDPSLLRKAGSAAMSGLGAVGNFFDLPGSMLRDFASTVSGNYNNPFDQLLSPFSADNRTTGQDLLQQWGAQNKEGTGSLGNTVGRFGSGLGLEIALDPLTYLTFGAAAYGKAGKIAQRAGMSDDIVEAAMKKAGGAEKLGRTMGKREAAMNVSLKDLVDFKTAATPTPFRKQVELTKLEKIKRGNKGVELTDDMMKAPIGKGPIGLHVPFTDKVASVGGEKVAKFLDDTGTAIRYGQFSPVRYLAPQFNKSVQKTKTALGQTFASKASKAASTAASGAREMLYPIAARLNKSGILKGDDATQAGMDMSDFLEDIGRRAFHEREEIGEDGATLVKKYYKDISPETIEEVDARLAEYSENGAPPEVDEKLAILAQKMGIRNAAEYHPQDVLETINERRHTGDLNQTLVSEEEVMTRGGNDIDVDTPPDDLKPRRFSETEEEFASRPQFDKLRNTKVDGVSVIEDLTQLKHMMSGLLDFEQKHGVAIEGLDDIASYFTRLYQSDAGGFWSANARKAFDTADPFAIGRKDYMRGWNGGTSLINRMSIDPEFAGKLDPSVRGSRKLSDDAKKILFERFKQRYRKELIGESSFGDPDGWEQRARQLFESIGARNKADVDAGVTMFSLDPAKSGIKRAESGLKSIANLDQLAELLPLVASRTGKQIGENESKVMSMAFEFGGEDSPFLMAMLDANAQLHASNARAAAPSVKAANAAASVGEEVVEPARRTFNPSTLNSDAADEAIPIPKEILERAKEYYGGKEPVDMTDDEVFDLIESTLIGMPARKKIQYLERLGIEPKVVGSKTTRMKNPDTGEFVERVQPTDVELDPTFDMGKVREQMEKEFQEDAKMLLSLGTQGSKPVWMKEMLKDMAEGKEVDPELLDAARKIAPENVSEKEINRYRGLLQKANEKKAAIDAAKQAAADDPNISYDSLMGMKNDELKPIAKSLGVYDVNGAKLKLVGQILEAAGKPTQPTLDELSETLSAQVDTLGRTWEDALQKRNDMEKMATDEHGDWRSKSAENSFAAQARRENEASDALVDAQTKLEDVKDRQAGHPFGEGAERIVNDAMDAIREKPDAGSRAVKHETLSSKAARVVSPIMRRAHEQLAALGYDDAMRNAMLRDAADEFEGRTPQNFAQKLADEAEAKASAPVDEAVESVADDAAEAVAPEIDPAMQGVTEGALPTSEDWYKRFVDGSSDLEIEARKAADLGEVVRSGSPDEFLSYSFNMIRQTMEESAPDVMRRAEDALGVADGNWTQSNLDEFNDGLMKYMRDGVAPEGLTGLMDRVVTWMRNAFSKMTGKGDSIEKVNPALGAVFESVMGSPKQPLSGRGTNLRSLLTSGGARGSKIGNEHYDEILVERLGKSAQEVKQQIMDERMVEAKRQTLLDGMSAGDDISNPDDYLEGIDLAAEIPEPTAQDILDRFDIPEEIATDVSAMHQRIERGQVGAAIDAYTNWFKTHVTAVAPGFHVRNAMSGFIQNVLNDVGDPRYNAANPLRYTQPYADAKNIELGKDVKGASSIPGLEGMTDAQATEELRKWGWSHGVMDTPGMINDIATATDGSVMGTAPGTDPSKNFLDWIRKKAAPPQGTTLLDSFNPAKTGGFIGQQDKFVLARYGRAMGDWVENGHRMGGFIALLRQGFDPAEAAKRVKELQLDYSNLSDFERNYARKAAPFYSYTRQMSEMMINELGRRPGGPMAQSIRAANRAGQRDDALTPDYVRQGLSVPLGKQEDGTLSYWTGLGLMHEAPLNLFQPNLQGALFNIGGQLNPLFKAPIELATDESLFQSSPTGGRSLDDLDPLLGRIGRNVSNYATGESVKEPYKLNKNLELLVANSPMARYLSTIRSSTDQRKPAWKRAINILSGLRFTDVSPAAQEGVFREQATALMREMGAKEFARVYFPDNVLESMDTSTREQAEEWNAVVKLLGKRTKDRKKVREAAEAT